MPTNCSLDSAWNVDPATGNRTGRLSGNNASSQLLGSSTLLPNPNPAAARDAASPSGRADTPGYDLLQATKNPALASLSADLLKQNKAASDDLSKQLASDFEIMLRELNRLDPWQEFIQRHLHQIPDPLPKPSHARCLRLDFRTSANSASDIG